MLIFALTLALQAEAPTPLTETHQRDIACVAVIAILAGEQERGVAAAKTFKDIRQAGQDWTPIVGERVMRETGQPKELVAVAMQEAAKAEQYRVADGAAPATVAPRIKECTDLMYIDLGKAVLDQAQYGTPLPKPAKSQ